MPKTEAARQRRKVKRQQKRQMRRRGQAEPMASDSPVRDQQQAARKVYKAVANRFKTGNRAVQDLAEVMTMPCMDAIRFPTEDMPRSSVTICTDQRNVVTPTTSTQGFPTGDILIAYFGQPGRLAMIWGPMLGASGTWYFGQSLATAIGGRTTRIIDVPPSYATVTPISVWLDPIGVALDTPVHGNTQTVGKQDNHTFLWLNVGDTVTISCTTTGIPAVGTLYLKFVRFQGANSPVEDIWEQAMVVSSSAGTTTYTHTSAGAYVAVIVDSYTITSGTISAGQISIFATGVYQTGTGWSQVAISDCDPNAAGDMNMLEEARVNGASMLATNVSSALNRQGTVLAARLRQVPFWKVSPAMLGRAAEKYQGDAAHGCYTFFEFSDARQRFANCNTDYAASFDLDYNDYYHFVELSCPAFATAPNSYAVKFDTLLEYKTDIGRYGKATSDYQYQDLIAARKLINSVPVWFYENPTHAREIYGLIKRALGGAWKIGKKIAPYAINAASAANPELAPLLQALKLVL